MENNYTNLEKKRKRALEVLKKWEEDLNQNNEIKKDVRKHELRYSIKEEKLK